MANFPDEIRPPSLSGYTYPERIKRSSNPLLATLFILLIGVLFLGIPPILSKIEGFMTLMIAIISVILIPLLIYYIHEKIHEIFYEHFGNSAKVRWLNAWTIAPDSKIEIRHFFVIVLAPLILISAFLSILWVLILSIFPNFINWNDIFLSLIFFHTLMSGGDIYQSIWLYKNSGSKCDKIYMNDVKIGEIYGFSKYRGESYLYCKR